MIKVKTAKNDCPMVFSFRHTQRIYREMYSCWPDPLLHPPRVMLIWMFFQQNTFCCGVFWKIPLTRWNMQGGRSDESLIEDREPSIEDGQTNLRRQSGETFLLQPVFLYNIPCDIKVSCWSRFMLNIEHWAACYIANYFIGRLSFSESFSDFTESLVTFMYSFLLSYYRSKSV